MIQGGRRTTNECHYATVVDRVCIGGKAEDMGETCVCPEASAPNRLESPSVYDADSWCGAPLVLGVCGPPDCAGTLPMNQEGTQPRSPVSSLTACDII